jgi:hypothetical protein
VQQPEKIKLILVSSIGTGRLTETPADVPDQPVDAAMPLFMLQSKELSCRQSLKKVTTHG